MWKPDTRQWLVARFGDVNALLRDRRLGRTYLHVTTQVALGPESPPEWQDPFWRLVQSGMLDMEPPDHTRLRRLVSKAFTPSTVEGLRAGIEAIVDRLLTATIEHGTFDLIGDVAEPLPVTVIADLLGVPEADRHLLRPWSADICLMYVLNPPRGQPAAVGRGQHRVRRLPARPRPAAARPPWGRPDLGAGPGRRLG